MIAFDAALRGGRLVSPKSLEKMWSNSRLNNGIPALSGLGFSDVTYVRGHRSAFKGGQAGVNYTVFPDDGLSVILLANLEASSWSLSANKVASFFAPEIQPLSNLQIQTDPDPARTAKLRRAMDDIASGVSPSALLTPKMNASITPDFRAGTKQLLGSLSELKFLACEKPSPNDPYGTAQYCYYRAHVGDAVFDLGFGLARNGQLAAAMGQPE
jgi:hypothetical protein